MSTEQTRKEVFRMKQRKNKIAGYRVMMGKNQKEFSELLNMSPQSYGLKERGKRPFKDGEKKKIKDLFSKINPEISYEELFF